jgi:deazaflavin-dependent oxidoreductase (nitroreductase family)
MKRPPGLDRPHARFIVLWMGRIHTWMHRVSGGRLGGTFQGVDVLLLTTAGRRSGLERTNPVLYLEDGARLVIVASKAGMDHHPAWFHNLVAHPEVSVQTGGQSQSMRTRVADAAERAELWPRLNALYANYDTYQGWTDRELPVVILDAWEEGGRAQ